MAGEKVIMEAEAGCAKCRVDPEEPCRPGWETMPSSQANK